MAIKTDERRNTPRNDTTVRRYFDTKYKHMVVKLLPGDHYVTGEPSEMLVTVLGSCVAACIRDPETGIGGMNHFMLPEGNASDWRATNAVMRYGNHAMEVLINDIMKLGCPRERMEIKVFGGANVIGGGGDVGHRNASFVEEYLKNEGFRPVAVDLRGDMARRIHYFPETGKVQRLLMRRASDRQVFNQETSYQKKMQPKERDSGGDIELFD
ncbi:chemoreceptor glutamine deamidase CheD [Kordiimonas pumila]|uniref:Probable chemoreceptor glutamine deamidase CheD n=1 Tax=Kordiimonas pumila TaxID=2161677 RepID=A0ABV7D0Y8_9PROT|nr:chemoreceptor glutamine deamidase CheD [Kordiimonas pumila]